MRIPHVVEGWVAGGLADRWGCARLVPGSPGPLELPLFLDASLRVRVLDSSGGPLAKVMIALRERSGLALEGPTVSSDEDGLAVLPHAGWLLHSRPGAEFVVTPAALFDPPLQRAIGVPDLEQAVTLVLPPSGACEVWLVDEVQSPVLEPFEASLAFADGPRSDGLRVEAVRTSRAGEPVLFGPVALGRRLALVIRRGDSGAVLETRALGPRVQGECVRLPVEVSADRAVLHGRLVDGAGIPLAEASVRARLQGGEGIRAGSTRSLQTDATGRFSLVAEPTGPDAGLVLILGRLSPEGALLSVARRPLPAGLLPGTNSLGDCVLAEAPVVVAGTVLDARGEPVPAAQVVPSVLDASDAEAVELAPVQSDELGRFEVRDEVVWSGITLLARKDGALAGPRSVRAGERGVRLVLEPGGGIGGTVLLDPSARAELILVQAEPPEPAPPTTAIVGEDGRFVLEGLPGGPHRVSVVHARTAQVLGAVDGVVVRGGQVTRDARLDPIDLRTASRFVLLALVDELDRPLVEARAFSRPSGDSGAPWVYSAAEGGRLALLTDGPRLDVAIVARGFQRTELQDVGEDRRVVLRRAAELRLVLTGVRAPEAPLSLAVRLVPLRAGFAGLAEGGWSSFGAEGEVHSRTAFTGTLQVELALRREAGAGSAVAYLREDTPRLIHVAEHPGEQRFEIRCTPEALAAAVRELSDQ
ncbi:MAG TPA: carboxypeptidase-like regulatory domain-containing protein [Planctomycetota bacterium]